MTTPTRVISLRDTVTHPPIYSTNKLSNKYHQPTVANLSNYLYRSIYYCHQYIIDNVNWTGLMQVYCMYKKNQFTTMLSQY